MFLGESHDSCSDWSPFLLVLSRDKFRLASGWLVEETGIERKEGVALGGAELGLQETECTKRNNEAGNLIIIQSYSVNFCWRSEFWQGGAEDFFGQEHVWAYWFYQGFLWVSKNKMGSHLNCCFFGIITGTILNTLAWFIVGGDSRAWTWETGTGGERREGRK